MTIRTALALTTAGLALAPAAASAATLTVAGDSLQYTAAPGETNSVYYTRDYGQAPGTITIGDLAGDITYPGDRCEEDNGSVRCTGVTGTIRLDLGDGNDSAGQPSGDTLENRVEVHGGPGDDQLKAPIKGTGPTALFGDDGADTLKGAAGADELHGGAGSDTLDGFGASDALHGDDGDDILDGDSYQAAAADVIDGGAGTDRVGGWTGPTPQDHPPVSVSLDGAANDGRAGESDNVTNVERLTSNVSGSFTLSDAADTIDVWANLDSGASTIKTAGGNDAIRGGTFEETIDAGPGDDRIEAGYGNDTIVAGPGRDTVIGDKAAPDCGMFESCSLPYGDDTIDVRDGEVDSVSCGVGNDRVLADTDDTVAPDCETVQRGGAVILDPGARTTCTMTARRRGRVVTVKGVVKGLADAEGTTVIVRLTSNGRRKAVSRELLDGRARFTARLRTKARRKLVVRATVAGTSTKARVR